MVMSNFKIRIIQRDKAGRTVGIFDIEVGAENRKHARRIARILHPLPQYALGKVWSNE